MGRFALCLATVVVAMTSCQQEDFEDRVALPETGLLIVRPQWAIVVESYVRLLAAPGADNEITGHLRDGDVVEIVEIGTTQFMISGSDDAWFLVEDGDSRGWVTSSALALFGSRNQAENAAFARFVEAGNRER